ncbi:Uncharacterised protein [Providencia alcalifaciens]|nr:Uncharacterised protein [Providencia alcalifaciens]
MSFLFNLRDLFPQWCIDSGLIKKIHYWKNISDTLKKFHTKMPTQLDNV